MAAKLAFSLIWKKIKWWIRKIINRIHGHQDMTYATSVSFLLNVVYIHCQQKMHPSYVYNNWSNLNQFSNSLHTVTWINFLQNDTKKVTSSQYQIQ